MRNESERTILTTMQAWMKSLSQDMERRLADLENQIDELEQKVIELTDRVDREL